MYENWRADGGRHRVTFHRAECRSCNDGKGIDADAGSDNGRWLRFTDIRAGEAWAEQAGADRVHPCMRCLPDRDAPGTFRASDGTQVAFAEALSRWQSAARPILIDVAGRYHEYITYGELGEAVQYATGIYTRMLLGNWIGRVLGAVSADCHRRDEPMLSALCIREDHTIGPGLRRCRDRALRKGSSRLGTACSGGAIALLPPLRRRVASCGGSPVLPAKEVLRRRARQVQGRPAIAERRLCPTCNLQLPLSGQCDFCT